MWAARVALACAALCALVACGAAGRGPPRFRSGLDHASYLDAPARRTPKESSDDPCHEVEDRYLAQIEALEERLYLSPTGQGTSFRVEEKRERAELVRNVAGTLQSVGSEAEASEACERLLSERLLSRHFEYAAVGSDASAGESDQAPVRGSAKRSCEAMLQRHQRRNRRQVSAHAERTLELLEADHAVVVLSTRGTAVETAVYRFDSDGSVALVNEFTAYAAAGEKRAR